MAAVNGQASHEILIVGAGVFGLSTALTLLDRPAYSNSKVTIIDSATVLPNPVGSSVDASRIVRADYGHKSYAKLASEAQHLWRDTSPTGWGGEGRYQESGFVLTGDHGQEDYVRKSMRNVQDLAASGNSLDSSKIQELTNKDEIRKASGLPGTSGDMGYANWNSGWAYAEACVAFALRKIKSHDRVTVRPGCKVVNLIFTDDSTDRQCAGVQLEDGSTIHANLTILATGAWTPSLFNLEYRCLATGQVIAYVAISPEEQAYLEKTPVVINFARGTFVIPPLNCELKIARHGYGYRNPLHVDPLSSSTSSPYLKEISVPRTDTSIPIEAETTLREAFAELFPPNLPPPSPDNPPYPSSLSTISTRPFTRTRVCWYTDTPTGNFLIDYPPLPGHNASKINKSLFLATGGSGHGFKFFPILGTYIVDALERNLAPEYADLWKWSTDDEIQARFSLGEYKDAQKQFIECEDGSRGGPRGMILQDELAKGAAML